MPIRPPTSATVEESLDRQNKWLLRYGYVIQPGDAAEEIKNWSAAFVRRHEADIDWVLGEFGNLNASELELASTIVYVDQEWRQGDYHGTVRELADRVAEIKPRFARDAIQRRAENMRQHQLVTAIAISDSPAQSRRSRPKRLA